MAEGAQRKVQAAVNDLLLQLDKQCLRKMQRNMHTCAAKCCENEELSMEAIQQCMDGCSKKLRNAQSQIESEMNSFQDRLGRCAQSCQDKIRDQVGPSTKEEELPTFQSQLETCIVECADQHIALLPKIKKKLVDSIDKSV